MKQLIKNKLGNQWRTVVLDGNSSSVNLTVRKGLKKYSGQAAAAPTNFQPLVVVLYFESRNIFIPQYTRKSRKKKNVNPLNETHDPPTGNPASLSNSPSIETSVELINGLSINEATSRNDIPPSSVNKLPITNMLRITTADLPNQNLLKIDFDLKNTKLVIPDNQLRDKSILPVSYDCSNKNSSQLDDKLTRDSPLQFDNKLPNHILLPLDENLEKEIVFSYGDYCPNDDLLSFDHHIENKSVYSHGNNLKNDNLMSAGGHLEKENVFLRNDKLPNNNFMSIDDELSNTKLVPRINDLLNRNTKAVGGQYLSDDESPSSDNVRQTIDNNFSPDLTQDIIDLCKEEINRMMEYDTEIDETRHTLNIIQNQLNETKRSLDLLIEIRKRTEKEIIKKNL